MGTEFNLRLLFFLWGEIFLLLNWFPAPAISIPLSVDSINPNFTVSYQAAVDNMGGAFLSSANGTYRARITNANPESESYYFVVTHVVSNTMVWCANRNIPISRSSQLHFSGGGLTLYNDSGHPIWSTPPTIQAVSSMRLLESGNLILIDSRNNLVWESFSFPTDVIVSGQNLHVGNSIVSSNNTGGLSEGSYRFVVAVNDAILQWNGMDYWKMSMGTNAYRDTNFPVDDLMMNSTGLYLIAENRDQVVIRIPFQEPGNSSNPLMLELESNGTLTVVTMDGSNNVRLRVPGDTCRVPNICRKLGVCSNGGSCRCAQALNPDNTGDCVPTNTSLALQGPCGGSSSNGTGITYLPLGENLSYYSIRFDDPMLRDVNLSTCQNQCNMNCSCLAVFHGQNSGSCYMVMNHLGSLLMESVNNGDLLGYVKVLEGKRTGIPLNNKSIFTILAIILLPSAGAIAAAVVAALLFLKLRRRWANNMVSELDQGASTDDEKELVSILNLPVRFDYKEIEGATERFSTQIGAGGFGIVYKGVLNDGTEVAVKKMSGLGSRGRREFLTEIAVIGKIHHINLVGLKGFCTCRDSRYLVYEFMSRGSLDRTLFGGDPVLEWGERYEIALGTAKGLTYLHTECDDKIIHCDVKPENILLDDSHVKISDFGLSKLLSPEQSGFMTTMRGTRGYLAPEWLTSSFVSDKTDVYSYGMVLLEIIRGKKNSSPETRRISSGNESSQVLPSSYRDGSPQTTYFPLLALEMHEQRRYLELVDPKLIGRVRSEDVEKLVRVALCCVHEDPNLRPSMANVVQMLEGSLPLVEPRIESLNFLRFYGNRFDENSRLEVNVEYQTSLTFVSPVHVSGPR